MTNAIEAKWAAINNKCIATFDKAIAKRMKRVAQVQSFTGSNKKILLWEAETMLKQAQIKKEKFLKLIALEAQERGAA